MTVLLASDLDGTLIPYELTETQQRALERFRSLFDQNGVWGAGETDRRPLLAYVTGRHRALAEAGIAEFGLPEPDILVCDVGTALYWRRPDGWFKDTAYERRLADSWPGSRAIGEQIDGIDDLVLQEAACQGPLKRSYYLPPHRPDLVETVQERLQAAGIAAKVVFSIDHRRKLGLLDILPPTAAKDAALVFLAEQLGVPLELLVYAGDSGNDLDAFRSGCRAIVVANTDEHTRRQLAACNCSSDSIYFSQTPYTAGVLEGCRYFGILR